MNYQLPVEAAWVRPWIGIPYEDDGNSEKGINCWNLMAWVERDVFGKDIPSIQVGEVNRVAGMHIQEFATYVQARINELKAKEIDVKLAKKGDILLVRFTKERLHVGVCICKGWILHICEGGQSQAEPTGLMKVVGAYRA